MMHRLVQPSVGHIKIEFSLSLLCHKIKFLSQAFGFFRPISSFKNTCLMLCWFQRHFVNSQNYKVTLAKSASYANRYATGAI